MADENVHSVDQSIRLKDKNRPVFLTNDGFLTTHGNKTWAYQRASEWQTNPTDYEERHTGVHQLIRSNASSLELLPNELIENMFEYLPVMDLFRNFYYLNERFQRLVHYHVSEQAHLRLDLSDVSLREFDFICSQFDPKQVEVLTLGDGHLNRIDETCVLGQIALFLSQFPSLKSLRIIEPYDDNQVNILLNQLSENQLKHLWIRFRRHSQTDLDFCLPFMKTIESLVLDHITLDDVSKLPQMNFHQLQSLSINDISITCLRTLLRGMLCLRYLNVKLISNAGHIDVRFIQNYQFQLTTLNTLHIQSNELPWTIVQMYCFNHMPNLYRLSLIGDYKTPPNRLAEQWKECFLTYTPHLTDFRFYINIPSINRSLNFDEILQPFYEDFWQERKWHVVLDITEERNLNLCSLPYPHSHQPLNTNCYIERRLTTLPQSFNMNSNYFDRITSLVTCTSNQSSKTSALPVFYRNIRSLIINENHH